MTKRQFVKRYSGMSPEERRDIKDYYIDLHFSAVFGETLKKADERLSWIREYERGETK